MKQTNIKSLNDVCKLVIDCEHKTAPIQETGYPSIRTPNIGKGRLILENVNRVSDETYKGWTKRAVPQAEDLVLAREAPVGNVAIIPKNLKVCLGQRTVLIRVNKGKVNPHYLVYLLLSDEIQGKIKSISNGATVHHLNMKDIRNLELPELPLLEAQRKIASILSSYDDLIENNTRRIEILEQMAKLVYEEWFIKFRFPGHENLKMVPSDLGEIPEGWEVSKIGDIFTVVLGGTPSRKREDYWNGNIPWINSGKVNELRIINESEGITELGLKKSATKMMPVRTTVLAITGATLGQISLTEIEVCANQSVVGIYDEKKIYSEYIFLKIKEIIGEVILKAGGGAQQHINKEIVNETEVIVPPSNLIEDFNSVIKPIFNQISILLFKNQNLRKTRDLLLPKLISGEIDVSDLDIHIRNEFQEP